MTKDEMNRLIDRHFAMEVRADIEGVLATCCDDIEYDAVGLPGGAIFGKPAVGRYYEALLHSLATTDMAPLHRYYGENVLVDEVAWEANAIGRVFGAGGPGRSISVRLLHVFEFRQGLIARENVWLDWVAFAAQLGALPSAAMPSRG